MEWQLPLLLREAPTFPETIFRVQLTGTLPWAEQCREDQGLLAGTAVYSSALDSYHMAQPLSMSWRMEVEHKA